jgi:hypothetical protein
MSRYVSASELAAPPVGGGETLLGRFVDRGAITAAFVGLGVAVVSAISFLLIIPIEPVYSLLSIPAGLLVGYYANWKSGRGRGEWLRTVANALFAGAATGLTLAILLLGVKALFFNADDGYRDPSQGGRISCVPGADCVYQRYLESQPDALRAAGVSDAASFGKVYWDQQLNTAETLLIASIGGGLGGGVIYGLTRPRRAREG